MYKIHENEFINLKQVTRVWLDTKRETGIFGDYSGSYDRTYYIVKVELSSGAMYEFKFDDFDEAMARLYHIAAKVA